MHMSTHESLRRLCRQRLALLHRTLPTPVSEEQIFQIIQTNLSNGRFQRFAAHRSRRHPFTLADYIDLVLLQFSREHERLALLEKDDSAEWQRLGKLLAHRAWRIVRHFRDGTDAWEEALNFAQETCLIIFEQRYPFDVSFEIWATRILKNLILARYERGTDILDRRQRLQSLDAPDPTSTGNILQESIADDQSLTPFDRVENQTLLLNAIAQLSPAQRQVIQDTFLRELDDAQIARRLGKSKQAVYNLRHRALARLQQILTRQTPPQEKGRKMH